MTDKEIRKRQKEMNKEINRALKESALLRYGRYTMIDLSVLKDFITEYNKALNDLLDRSVIYDLEHFKKQRAISILGTNFINEEVIEEKIKELEKKKIKTDTTECIFNWDEIHKIQTDSGIEVLQQLLTDNLIKGE